MMKKIISLGVTLVILISLSACRIRNFGIENRNGGTNNDAANKVRQIGMEDTNNGVTNDITNLRGTTDTNNNARGNYKDGTYTGFGNGNPEGIERAIVTIRNGRIANIDLATVGQQETANNVNTAETRTNNQTVTNNNANNGAGAGTNNLNGTGAEIRNAAGDAINRVRTDLINAIIQNQNANVAIADNDTNVGNRISNWKLAVTRALEQAK